MYARRIGVDPSPALAALGSDGVRFRAVASTRRDGLVQIMNSDQGFALLFLDAAPAEVQLAAGTLTRPFPAGSPDGRRLARREPRARLADELEPQFGPQTRYHGTVISSWQQGGALAAGIDRQIVPRISPPSAARG